MNCLDFDFLVCLSVLSFKVDRPRIPPEQSSGITSSEWAADTLKEEILAVRVEWVVSYILWPFLASRESTAWLRR